MTVTMLINKANSIKWAWLELMRSERCFSCSPSSLLLLLFPVFSSTTVLLHPLLSHCPSLSSQATRPSFRLHCPFAILRSRGRQLAGGLFCPHMFFYHYFPFRILLAFFPHRSPGPLVSMCPVIPPVYADVLSLRVFQLSSISQGRFLDGLYIQRRRLCRWTP